MSVPITRRWQRFASKRPETAERMRRMADAVAVKFDTVLDLLPGRWSDRLALPDLLQPIRGDGRARGNRS